MLAATMFIIVELEDCDLGILPLGFWRDFVFDLQVSLGAFAYLFSELVQYNQTQVDNIGELEKR